MLKPRLLIFILVVAGILRLWGLTSSPPALNWDEVSIGVNAYSILKTGRDEWGAFLPLSFRAYGEQKLPGMIYASIPGIALFGLNEVGVRITPAVIGVLAVYALYLLGTQLISTNFALAAAALLAISPWHVHLSRASFEAGLGLLFVELSIYYFLCSRLKSRALFLAVVFAVLGLYSYNSVRIFLPLLYAILLWRDRLHLLDTPRLVIRLGIFIFILLLPIFISLRDSSTLVRWNTLNTLHNEGFLMAIGESRRYTPLPEPLPRLIHNKYTHLGYKFFLDYLHTFSSEFLFFQGSAQTQRSVQGMGLLYFFEFPLLIAGLLELKNKKYAHLRLLLIPWIILAPIPSAITVDAPSSLRALNLLPPLLLIEALGLLVTWSWFSVRANFLKIIAGLFILWNIGLFVYRLLGAYPIKYSGDWQWGYKQMIQEVIKYSDQVDKVYITSDYGEPHMYLLFYGRPDLLPKYQTPRFVDRTIDPLGWVHVVSFDKYYFVDFEGTEVAESIIRDNPGKKILLVTGFAQLSEQHPRLFAISAPSMQVMFEGAIVENPQ